MAAIRRFNISRYSYTCLFFTDSTLRYSRYHSMDLGLEKGLKTAEGNAVAIKRLATYLHSPALGAQK